MHRNKTVMTHEFSMIPNADIPRSSFDRVAAYKSTFDAGYLIPFMCDEVLPGDTFNVKSTLFARMTTPIFPIMDNLFMDTFFFFVPNRLVWSNWQKFMGQQANPADSISYVIPQQVSPNGGYAVGSLQDYFGLPTVGQVGGGNNFSHSALPLRGYNLIFNEWFRDENLQNSAVVDLGDGPDTSPSVNYALLRRGKRHDYFTSALPWPQKGNISVTLPLGTSAPVIGIGVPATHSAVASSALQYQANGTPMPIGTPVFGFAAGTDVIRASALGPASASNVPQIFADLSQATAATINQIRQSFQIQKLLERDARGGTRYTEIVRSHFGVVSPDMRLQRPEYLGGGSVPVNVNPVAQTSANASQPSPLGNLSAYANTLSQSGFTYSSTEHGYLFGLISVRADLTYQQGLERHWSRSTRYDFYFPVFAALGEQAVLNKEIYLDGSATDSQVFGYQERWAEYRYKPSKITGLFRSTSAGTLDGWHLSQRFSSLPTLNNTFIQENPPMSRILAVGSGANGAQFYLDGLIEQRVARPMPMYSVPGLIDHF